MPTVHCLRAVPGVAATTDRGASQPSVPLQPRHSWRGLLIVLVASALAAQQPKPPAAPPTGHEPPVPRTFEEALARYKECMERPPFRFHTEGREAVARFRTPEGLQLLVADYGGKKDYPEFTRYTLATMFGRWFDKVEFVPALDGLRRAHGKPVDTWLWFHVLKTMANNGRAEEVLAIAREDKAILHRAAAILALGHSRSGDCDSAILANCIEFPKKASDRGALVGAMSGAIDANKRRANDARFRETLSAYISLLSPSVGLSEALQLQIARHLQVVLEAPAMWVNPEPWQQLLQAGDVKTTTNAHTVSGQRFFGIESEGERICYVLDMSDSMCKEISPDMRPKGPVTGPRKKPKGALPDESDLPWHKIRTRFDLAREHLRISLERLPKEKYFSVVWFGDEAGTLDACKGMVKATKGNVDRVMAELDAIQPGPPDPRKSNDGTLRGQTNVHAGLLRAFGLAGRGYVEEAAYVDPEALTEGCDTIFLLSDGAPSTDEFNLVAPDYGEGEVVVDREYGVKAPRSAQIWYPGPYATEEWLVDDVERMNMLRRVRVHCIAIGEAKKDLLRRLAKACYGEVFVVGAK